MNRDEGINSYIEILVSSVKVSGNGPLEND